jgi:hypothetical protein
VNVESMSTTQSERSKCSDLQLTFALQMKRCSLSSADAFALSPSVRPRSVSSTRALGVAPPPRAALALNGVVSTLNSFL